MGHEWKNEKKNIHFDESTLVIGGESIFQPDYLYLQTTRLNQISQLVNLSTPPPSKNEIYDIWVYNI